MYSRKPYEGTYRKLVLAFDVGATFSGISYCIVDPGEVPEVRGVSRFPAQEHVGGSNKIPSIMYYDKKGRVQAVGAETLQLHIIEKAGKEEWVRLEWWILHLRSKHLETSHFSDADLPPLPKGKLAVEVLGDFLRYLFQCAKAYIEEVHARGSIIWDSLKDRMEFILTHPNGWEGPQQQQIRKATELAGLVPVGEEGQSRVHLLTEGEASLHFCVANFLTSEKFEAMPIAITDDPKEDDGGGTEEYCGVVLIDAGSETVDLSAYSMTLSPTSFREIAPAECRLQGSVFVTHRAHAFLRALLANSKYGDEDTLKRMADIFDKTTKLQFRNANEPQYIKFGLIRDKELKYNIRSGQLKFWDVAKFFDPSVEEIISAFEVQREAASIPITCAFLVGSFATSDWLHSSLRKYMSSLGIAFYRPSPYIRAVVDGAVSYYLDHLVSGRPIRFTYGIPCSRSYVPHDAEHVSRRSTAFTALSGDLRLPNGFGSVLTKGTGVFGQQESRGSFYREEANLSACESVQVDIVAYRGTGECPLWMDKEKESYTKLCTISADTSKVTSSLQPRRRPDGLGVYYTVDFDVVMLFNPMELKAQISWKENGVEVRSPATLLHGE